MKLMSSILLGLASLMATAAGQAAILPNTVALYTFANGDATDSSGNGYDLIVVGSVTFSTHAGKKAVDNFSSANYLQAPAGLRSAMQGLTQWTIEGDIYFKNNGPGGNRIFWSTDRADTYFLMLNNGGNSGAFRSSIQNNITDKSTLAKGSWYQWGVAYDGTQRHTWVGGVDSGGVTIASTLPSTITNMLLGVYANNTAVDPCDCYLSNVRFSDVYRASLPSIDPSNTPTPSPTDSPTPTATPTASPTFTPTATPSASPTASPTATPSFTFTPSFTPSPVFTATPTAIPTSKGGSVTDYRLYLYLQALKLL